VEAVGRLDELDRAEVRATFEDRFTAERMARDYVRLYEELTSPAPTPGQAAVAAV
jgi:hypothetical protein